jgi:hypothetical protein
MHEDGAEQPMKRQRRVRTEEGQSAPSLPTGAPTAASFDASAHTDRHALTKAPATIVALDEFDYDDDAAEYDDYDYDDAAYDGPYDDEYDAAAAYAYNADADAQMVADMESFDAYAPLTAPPAAQSASSTLHSHPSSQPQQEDEEMA